MARDDPYQQLHRVMTAFPQEPEFKILLVGEKGAGKTCLLNFLNGLGVVADNDLTQESILKLQKVGVSSGSTAQPTYNAFTVDGVRLCVVDTPGFTDTSGTPQDGEEDLVHSMLIGDAARRAEYFNCIVLVINGTQGRFQPSMRQALKAMERLLSEDFSQRIMVVFTFVDSAQKRAFPVDELRQALVLDKDPPYLHLENPLGRLTGLSEADLRGKLDRGDDDGEEADEVKREIKKGVRTAIDLLRSLRTFDEPVYSIAKATPLSSYWKLISCCVAPLALMPLLYLGLVDQVAEDWYSGTVGQSCTEACADMGGYCSNADLFAHNTEVDSSDEVIAHIQRLGGSTAGECSAASPRQSDVPAWTGDFCAFAGEARRPSDRDFDCDAEALDGQRRLCYCSSAPAFAFRLEQVSPFFLHDLRVQIGSVCVLLMYSIYAGALIWWCRPSSISQSSRPTGDSTSMSEDSEEWGS